LSFENSKNPLLFSFAIIATKILFTENTGTAFLLIRNRIIALNSRAQRVGGRIYFLRDPLKHFPENSNKDHKLAISAGGKSLAISGCSVKQSSGITSMN
jgi:hypothetical protein